MVIKIEIIVDSFEELQGISSKLANGGAAPVKTETERMIDFDKAKDESIKSRKNKEVVKETIKESEVVVEVKEASIKPSEIEKAITVEVTYDEVKAVVQKILESKTGMRDKLKSLLTDKFGTSGGVSTLKSEQYADFVAEASKLV
jgi:hypothetical protein